MEENNLPFVLEIKASVNGRVGKATVIARDKNDNSVLDTDRVQLFDGNDRRKVSRHMATRLSPKTGRNVTPEAFLEALETTWHNVLPALEQAQQEAAAKAAEPVAPRDHRQTAAQLLEATPPQVVEEARHVLQDPSLLSLVHGDVAALGVVGEVFVVLTIYLTATSRLLDKPLAVIVQGPTSSGKSHMIERVSSLSPPEATMYATAMTPQALCYVAPDSLRHVFLVGGERSRLDTPEQAQMTSILRQLLSEGKIDKVVTQTIGGKFVTLHIHQEGPIAFIESTTMTRIFDEDANRCLMLGTDESPEQTRNILRRQAEKVMGETSGAAEEAIRLRHHTMQRLLEPLPVRIPYADRIQDLFPNERVETRRGFAQLMSLVQAVALLYQFQRDRNSNGEIVAAPSDYMCARLLMEKPMGRLLGRNVSDHALHFLDRLRARFTLWCPFSVNDAKLKETRSPASVYNWIHELHNAGYLERVEEHRGQRGATWQLVEHPPTADGGILLPTPESVFGES